MTPRGTLLIIGGAEDKGGQTRPAAKDDNVGFKGLEILSQLVPPADAASDRIEVITTASEVPSQMAQTYKRAFRRLGCRNVGHLHIENKGDANKSRYVERIQKAHAVLFSGGDQFRLSTILSSTDVINAVRERYYNDREFIVAGTSAGAMAMSRVMIWEGSNNEAMLKGDVRMSSGFGFLDTSIVDTHFVKRGRFARLSLAVITNSSCIGIGIGEDTALVIRRGNIASCIGSGMVVVIDGGRIAHTNVAYAESGEAICVQNLIVHILTSGNGFLLHERQFIPSKEDIKREHHP